MGNLRPDGTDIVTADKMVVVHQAVLAACDTIDGLADRQLEDPRACDFEPGTLQCPAGRWRTSSTTRSTGSASSCTACQARSHGDARSHGAARSHGEARSHGDAGRTVT
jgi:tannase/feruloyl esterase